MFIVPHRLRVNHAAFAWPAALLLLVGSHAVAYRSAPRNPAIIATFDLEKTINALDQFKQSDEQLVNTAETLDADIKARMASIKQLQTEIEDHVKGGKKYNELLDKIEEATYAYEASKEFGRGKLNDERARGLLRTYDAIKLAAATLAQEHGIDVVFVDDSIKPIEPGDIERTIREVSARRMVYTGDAVNITDMLIERMNKDFASQGGGAGKP